MPSFALLLILAALTAHSQQVTGSISGSVRDTTDASVAAASLSLISVATGAARRLLTDETGNFVISSVDPGEYRLTVRAPGFKTFERKGVILSASERLSVGVLSLELGSVEERVTVTAEGAAVQTVSAGGCYRHAAPESSDLFSWWAIRCCPKAIARSIATSAPTCSACR